MSTLKFLAVVFTLVVSSLFAVDHLAQAQPGQGTPAAPRMMCQDRFASMDTSKDGLVDRDEFMAVDHPRSNAEQMFTSRDTNSDSFLTEEEFCAGKGMRGRRGR